MDRNVLWRAALVQVCLIVPLSLALGLALPDWFFDDWGWLSGPAAWLLCAWATARVLELPRLRTVIGAALAGIPSIVAVVAGVHGLGVVLAVALFALWCARLGRVSGARPTAPGAAATAAPQSS
jgi:hypothetical protein